MLPVRGGSCQLWAGQHQPKAPTDSLPVLVCHGTCMQRIKRNSTYYITSDGVMLWCQKCHTGLPQVVMEVANGPPVLKRQLLRCKSDEEVAEPWVSCDGCGKWVHEICGLYNERFADADADNGGGAGKPPSRDVMQAAAKAARTEMLQRVRESKGPGGNGGPAAFGSGGGGGGGGTTGGTGGTGGPGLVLIQAW